MRRFAPAWVYGGGFLLAAVAGAVNSVAWLGAEHQGITHVTGALTELGTSAARGALVDAARVAVVIGAFLGGATMSGAIIQGSALRFGRRYGTGLLFEGALLALAYVVRVRGQLLLADALAAGACGLQNALATSFSGAVVRTTHMTGLVTDLGLMFGHALRGEPVDAWRLWLYLSLLAGFVGGGAAGAGIEAWFGDLALLVPAGVVASLGVVHWGWVHLRADEPTR